MYPATWEILCESEDDWESLEGKEKLTVNGMVGAWDSYALCGTHSE